MSYLNVPYSDFSGRLSLTKSTKEAILKFMFLPYFFKKVGREIHISSSCHTKILTISIFCLIEYIL